MGVAVERELQSHILGQRSIGCGIFGAEFVHHVGAHILAFHSSDGGVAGKHVVEFGDEFLDSGDEFDKALGDEHSAEVVAFGGACGHDVGDIVHHVLKSI